MPYMEFLRGIIKQTALNAYAQVAIRTPTSKTEVMAMLIHDIELIQECPEVIDATITVLRYHIADRTHTFVRGQEVEGVLIFTSIGVNAGATQGTLSEYMSIWQEGSPYRHFDPPVLYARDEIYLGMESVACTGLHMGVVQIGYTLERVSREDFIAALVD